MAGGVNKTYQESNEWWLTRTHLVVWPTAAQRLYPSGCGQRGWGHHGAAAPPSTPMAIIRSSTVANKSQASMYIC